MTTLDYIVNAGFLLLVARQAREHELDRRSFVLPLVLVFFVGREYLHRIPTAGNDLVLILALTSLGVTLGVLCGFATRVRVRRDGVALGRVGWLAGSLLAAGIGSRMVFAYAVTHGAGQAVRSFSIASHISADAWPVALVSMALCEVIARIVVVHLRARTLTSSALAAGAAA